MPLPSTDATDSGLTASTSTTDSGLPSSTSAAMRPTRRRDLDILYNVHKYLLVHSTHLRGLRRAR